MYRTMRNHRLLYWLPRGLGILFILFISIFALDVFDAGYGFTETLIALFMHLIPSFLLIAILIAVWRHSLLGSILFFIIAIGFTIFFHTYKDPIAFLIVSLPVFVISALFYFQSHYEKHH